MLANANVSSRIAIEFDLSAGRRTISPVTALPEIARTLTIDGWSCPGWQEEPIVELDGTRLETGHGLLVTCGMCVVRGLTIHSFPDSGIFVFKCHQNHLLGLRVGTNLAGDAARPNGRTPTDPSGAPAGIAIIMSNENFIGGTDLKSRVVASGNNGYGIAIRDGSSGNKVWNTFAGTNHAGTAAVENTRTGIWIYRSPDNEIGGETPEKRVVASGNRQYGIGISGSQATGNAIEGSHVGVSFDGRQAVPNKRTGILVFNAPDNRIGSGKGPAHNVISGNARAGINIDGSKFGSPPAWDAGQGYCRRNLIRGNHIGTDLSGTFAVPNGLTGLRLFKSQLSGILDNLISGNLEDGVLIQSDPERVEANEIASGNRIEGNRIGTNAAGTDALPNRRNGVYVMGQGNRIGGKTAETGNSIRFNSGWGVQVKGPDAVSNEISDHNKITGNVVGQVRVHP